MVQAAIAIAALAYQVYAGETQRAVAAKGRREAQVAAAEAESAALAEAKRGELAENRARQKTPDLNVLLSDSLLPRRKQPGSIDINRLTLGRPGQLGFSNAA